ncbi:protein C19orf12 homolog [Leptidea sinapis]|uniref:protein C19orf12 homolog n=1 Tax=Leptidea sinapis TaxID=189913 RepID=UPI0021C2D08B|nr:protein C19orf12 homolog [Leptidea sinapis]
MSSDSESSGSDYEGEYDLCCTSLSIAGALIGNRVGGKVGAAVGGAVGGACGLGVVAVTMREIWRDVREKLSELFDIVYDYLAGLGLEDYKRAAKFVMQNSTNSSQLAMLILQFATNILGKQILSSLTPM